MSPSSARRPWSGWFLMVASVLAIGLVLLQMSRQSPAAKISTAPPIETAPSLWTPRLQEGPAVVAPARPAPTGTPVRPNDSGSAALDPAAPALTPGPAATPPLPTAEVEVAVKKWATTWAARDVDAYLRCYAEDFPGREAFVRQKRGVISRAQFIEISLTDLRLRSLPDGRVEAQFTQRYRSNTYESTDLKRQVWERQGNGYRIIAEAS